MATGIRRTVDRYRDDLASMSSLKRGKIKRTDHNLNQLLFQVFTRD
jgi:hypothetical protein